MMTIVLMTEAPTMESFAGGYKKEAEILYKKISHLLDPHQPDDFGFEGYRQEQHTDNA